MKRTTDTPAIDDDPLISTKDAAVMIGYREDQHRAAALVLKRAGLVPWRNPDDPKSRTVRWYLSDIRSFKRRGGAPAPRVDQPSSEPSRFRKAS